MNEKNSQETDTGEQTPSGSGATEDVRGATPQTAVSGVSRPDISTNVGSQKYIEGYADGFKKGAKAERERILDILNGMVWVGETAEQLYDELREKITEGSTP